MKLKIDPKIFDQYPDVVIGVSINHDVDNTGENPEINKLLREAEKITLEKLGGSVVIEHPHIASWRTAYKLFGAKPKKYPSSIENLVRRILKGDQVGHINKLVDIYNVISLKHLVPAGGEDLDKIRGDVILTIAGEKETPVTLLGEKEARPPYPKEVIYRDTIGTICRRWNWKEVNRTKLTEDTKNAFIVIEGLLPVRRAQIQLALNELSEMIKKYCDGKVTTSILDRNAPQGLLK